MHPVTRVCYFSRDLACRLSLQPPENATKLFSPLTLIAMVMAVCLHAQTIPSFSFHDAGMSINHLAQPGTYFDKVGRRSAIIGHEDGVFDLSYALPSPYRCGIA